MPLLTGWCFGHGRAACWVDLDFGLVIFSSPASRRDMLWSVSAAADAHVVIKLENLIVFGDSLSDIGNKREQAAGMLARAFGWMRTNEIGRYSDCRNWTDFLWEWAGGRSLVGRDAVSSRQTSSPHRSLTADSDQDSGFGRPFVYCNYAEGGAMGASDRPAIGLGTFRQQVQRYIEQRRQYSLSGPTLHMIWFGLNDLVTNKRPPDEMGAVVDEIAEGMMAINQEFGLVNEHFCVINLPSPADAVRMLEGNDLQLAVNLDRGARVFNQHLLTGLADGARFPDPALVTLVDMHAWLTTVGADLENYGLVDGAQPHGVPVRYRGAESSDHRALTATSDSAHPTERMYRLIAREIARRLLERFELGGLSRSPLI